MTCCTARHTASIGPNVARPGPLRRHRRLRDDDPPRTIWPYRDWVIKAFNDNKPFDQFTIEQIAGDLLPEPDAASRLIATGFHRNTMTNSEGGTQDEEFRNAAVVDRVNTTMAVWMGTTIGLRPVPQPQVRSDLAERVFPVVRHPEQHGGRRSQRRIARAADLYWCGATPGDNLTGLHRRAAGEHLTTPTNLRGREDRSWA